MPPADTAYTAASRLADRVCKTATRMVVMDFPPLNIPFGTDVEARESEQMLSDLVQRGIAVIDVGQALKDEDVTALRQDLCCHYTDEGTGRLADLLEPLLLTDGLGE